MSERVPSIVEVCIPYRSRDAWSDRLYQRVRAFWADECPEWPVIVGDGGRPFSRAHARNECWRGSTAPVLVFCDADTIPLDADAVREAVEIAEAGGWVLPARYYDAGRPWTGRALRDGLSVPRRSECRRIIDDSPGGVMVVPRAALDVVRGWDEAFLGWGWEDTALRASLDALWGEHTKLGEVVHLWHPRPPRQFLSQPHARHNRARFRRYAEAWQSGTMADLYRDLAR